MDHATVINVMFHLLLYCSAVSCPAILLKHIVIILTNINLIREISDLCVNQCGLILVWLQMPRMTTHAVQHWQHYVHTAHY